MPRNRSSCATTTCAKLAAGLLAAAGLTGCDYSLNTDLTVGDDLVMPALVPAQALAEPTILPPDAVVGPAPEPSLTGVMRENWEETVFLVPIATVEHRAVTSIHPRYTTPATRGVLFPTEDTIFGAPLEPRVRRQAYEGLAAPFYSGLDLLMAVPRMFVVHPLTVIESPREGYERAPQRLPRVVLAEDLPEGMTEEAIEEPIEQAPPIPPPAAVPDDEPVPAGAGR